MAFSDFDLRTAIERFGLQEELNSDMFVDVASLEPSAGLRLTLEQLAPVALGLNTEKARSEYIIAPLLIEAWRRAEVPGNVFPGLTLDVDRASGLSGFCDSVISGSPEYYYLRGPLMAVVEAKKEDIIGGLGQCAAAMVAIRLFNERDGTAVSAVYGCVSSGSVWRFLRLKDSRLCIDRPEYYLHDAGKIVGILVHLLRSGGRV
jgi:hypothetical protein